MFEFAKFIDETKACPVLDEFECEPRYVDHIDPEELLMDEEDVYG